MTKPLLIFGVSSFAQIAKEYFSRSGEFAPVAFCLDDDWIRDEWAYGMPVLPISNVARDFDASKTAFHVAVTYTKMNQLRRDRVRDLMRLGFEPASYISPEAYVDPTARIGQHVFVFEDNTIQPFTTISDRVILWSGNHIGHHSVVEEDVFISSQVVVSGHCRIGARSFLGVNCAIGNNVNVGRENWILPGTNLLSDTGDDEMWRPQHSVKSEKRPSERFAG